MGGISNRTDRCSMNIDHENYSLLVCLAIENMQPVRNPMLAIPLAQHRVFEVVLRYFASAF